MIPHCKYLYVQLNEYMDVIITYFLKQKSLKSLFSKQYYTSVLKCLLGKIFTYKYVCAKPLSLFNYPYHVC